MLLFARYKDARHDRRAPASYLLSGGFEKWRRTVPVKKGVSKHHQALLRHNPAEIVDTSFWQSDIAILLLKEFSI